jgi:hypothetical protein
MNQAHSTFLDRSRLAFAPPHTQREWDHVTPSEYLLPIIIPPSRHRSGGEPATGEGGKASDRPSPPNHFGIQCRDRRAARPDKFPNLPTGGWSIDRSRFIVATLASGLSLEIPPVSTVDT